MYDGILHASYRYLWRPYGIMALVFHSQIGFEGAREWGNEDAALLSIGMIIAPELAKKVSGIVKAEGELGLHDAVAFMSPGNYTCISMYLSPMTDKKIQKDTKSKFRIISGLVCERLWRWFCCNGKQYLPGLVWSIDTGQPKMDGTAALRLSNQFDSEGYFFCKEDWHVN